MLLHDELRKFVTDNFMFGKPCEGFADDDSFIERGIIDSTAVMELIAFLEARFQIKLQDQELIPDNFDSINRLASFVVSRLQPIDTGGHDAGLLCGDRRFTRAGLEAMPGAVMFAAPLTSERKR